MKIDLLSTSFATFHEFCGAYSNTLYFLFQPSGPKEGGRKPIVQDKKLQGCTSKIL